jgi:hypothetical protein
VRLNEHVLADDGVGVVDLAAVDAAGAGVERGTLAHPA